MWISSAWNLYINCCISTHQCLVWSPFFPITCPSVDSPTMKIQIQYHLEESDMRLCYVVFVTDQKLTSQVHEIVGRINGRFGTLTAVPIHHLVCIYLVYFQFYICKVSFAILDIKWNKRFRWLAVWDWIMNCLSWFVSSRNLWSCVGDVKLKLDYHHVNDWDFGSFSHKFPLSTSVLNSYRMWRLLKHLFLYLQDRSLDFHALCALYAVTGTHFCAVTHTALIIVVFNDK